MSVMHLDQDEKRWDVSGTLTLTVPCVQPEKLLVMLYPPKGLIVTH